MAETALTALAERYGINTMVDLINNSDVDMDAYRAQLYYSKYALEKIKIGTENYVYLKYAKTQTIPKGHEQWVAIRTFPLTEHTVPLLEGIPPKSDKTRREKITGTFHQYARYMEFSDRVDFKLLDPIVMQYSEEYGDVAVRTMHRLARKEMLNTTMKNYANNKTSIGELVVGDYVGLADFRLAALKMARLAVRPISGVFVVITSEEHYWDLMKDPLIVEYIGSNNGLAHYKTGDLPELFGIRFEKTLMDDYAYGYELANPGEYYGYRHTGNVSTARLYDEFSLSDANVYCRAYLPFENGYVYGNIAASGHRTVYVSSEYYSASDFLSSKSRSVEEGLPDYDSAHADTGDLIKGSEAHNRLADGSWIPIRTKWTFTACDVAGITTNTTTATGTESTKQQLDSSSIYWTYVETVAAAAEAKGKGTYTLWFKYGAEYESIGSVELEAATNNTDPVLTLARINSILPTPAQLPVHQAIMLGEDALIRLEVEGEGNVQMFLKEKGSAGVLDPVNQRQSIGIKINTVGFKRLREEAVWVFYHVPTQAIATAGISLQ